MFELNLRVALASENWQDQVYSRPLMMRFALHAGPVQLTVDPITRHPKHHQRIATFYDSFLQRLVPPQEGKVDAKSSDWLPMLSLSWNLDDTTLIGAKWERARRAGGTTVNIARKSFDTYDPEIADYVDLFLRASRFDNRLTVGVNAFLSRNRELQLNAALSNTGGDAQTVNADRAKTKGLELEVGWRGLTWKMYLSAGLLKTDMESIQVGLVNFSGNEYPFAPKWNLSAGATYDPGERFFASADFTIQPSAFGSFDNRPGNRSEARQLLNGRVGWRWGVASLSLYGRNLLDDQYHVYRDLGLTSRSTQTVYQPDDPREVGMALDINW